MLRGQCSLSRLVGKRRRLDTSSTVDAVPSDSLLQDGAESLSNLPGPVGAGLDWNKEEKGFCLPIPQLTGDDLSLCLNSRDFGKENLPLNWVQCPVCEKDIQGDDGYINIHVDLCLLEKTSCNSMKPQRPMKHKRLSLMYPKECLLKSNSSKETAKLTTCVADLLSPELVAIGKTASLAASVGSPGECQPMSESVLENKNMVAWAKDSFTDHSLRVLHDCNCTCHHKKETFKLSEKKISSEPCSGLNQVKDAVVSCQSTCHAAELVSPRTNDHISRVYVLETLVVGRKFNRHVKVEKDMEIQVLREPENPKDSNAIKILGPESQGNLTLGHLPRDLASLLACLLDKELLQIKGTVIRVPEKASEPVPVTLSCERTRGKGTENIDSFEETWERILEAGRTVTQRQETFIQHSAKYLYNFTYVLRTVLERDSHLFDGKELELLGSFFSLTEDAQCLFVRLSQRKGPWFRVSQIKYSEISDVEKASHQLVASGFFTLGDSIEKEKCFEEALRERMHVLSVAELKDILSIVNVKHKRADKSTPKRDELLNWIMTAVKEKHQNLGTETGSNETAILSVLSKVIGFCIRVSDTASFLVWRLQRLFFLNGEQDISSFLLVEMGTIKYPSYVCSQTRKAFVTRQALLAYEQALEVAQAMDVAVEGNDIKAIEYCLERASLQLSSKETHELNVEDCGVKDPFLARFSAAWVFATVLTVGVSVLERERRYAEAIQLLKQLLNQSCCPGRRGYWTVRLSMDLEHLSYKEESLEVAEAGLTDTRIRHGDLVALQRRVLRLGKPPRRWKKPSFAKALAQSCKEVNITGRPLNSQTGTKSRFYGYDNDQCSVEELALQYYAGDSGGGWQGVHSEGGIWMTLFALLMWDILFADITNVFWHPFQAAPLDLNTDAFYPARAALVDTQLEQIRRGEASQILAVTWSNWFGTACRGLNWERHTLQELQLMASCLGGPGLASICRLLAEDYAGLSGGMPDLFLWRVPNSKVACALCSDGCPNAYSLLSGEAKLVEVKGPRDRLSDQQRAWISTLMDAGIDVEVCKVLEQSRK